MPEKKPIRPRWNHPEVKTAIAADLMEPIREWAKGAPKLEEFVNDDRQMLALISSALIECPDSYTCGRHLEDNYDWPTDGELIRIFDRGYVSLQYYTADAVRHWVLKTGIRFKAKTGDRIDFTHEGSRRQGVVENVINGEARAFVILASKGKERVSVEWECVLRVYSKDSKEGVQKNTPPTK